MKGRIHKVINELLLAAALALFLECACDPRDFPGHE